MVLSHAGIGRLASSHDTMLMFGRYGALELPTQDYVTQTDAASIASAERYVKAVKILYGVGAAYMQWPISYPGYVLTSPMASISMVAVDSLFNAVKLLTGRSYAEESQITAYKAIGKDVKSWADQLDAFKTGIRADGKPFNRTYWQKRGRELIDAVVYFVKLRAEDAPVQRAAETAYFVITETYKDVTTPARWPWWLTAMVALSAASVALNLSDRVSFRR